MPATAGGSGWRTGSRLGRERPGPRYERRCFAPRRRSERSGRCARSRWVRNRKGRLGPSIQTVAFLLSWRRLMRQEAARLGRDDGTCRPLRRRGDARILRLVPRVAFAQAVAGDGRPRVTRSEPWRAHRPDSSGPLASKPSPWRDAPRPASLTDNRRHTAGVPGLERRLAPSRQNDDEWPVGVAVAGHPDQAGRLRVLPWRDPRAMAAPGVDRLPMGAGLPGEPVSSSSTSVLGRLGASPFELGASTATPPELSRWVIGSSFTRPA
jgi:hypothetical protein